MPLTLGMLKPMASLAQPVVQFVVRDSSGVTSATTYNMGTVSIGEPSPDRLVAIVMTGHNGSSNADRPPVSFTVGGVAGTLHDSISESEGAGGNSNSMGIGSILVPDGTTAPITITFSGQMGSCVIFVYTVKGYSNPTPQCYKGSNSDPISLAFGSHPNGAAIGGAIAMNPSALVYSSTGTEQPVADSAQDVGSRLRGSFHMDDASGSPTVSVAFTGSNNDECFMAAVWT